MTKWTMREGKLQWARGQPKDNVITGGPPKWGKDILTMINYIGFFQQNLLVFKSKWHRLEIKQSDWSLIHYIYTNYNNYGNNYNKRYCLKW